MFTMMNAARLAVGMQGLGIAEIAYQSARAYARERLQGARLQGAQAPDKPADPIIVHPDVRRMLLTMQGRYRGCRALALLGRHEARHRPAPSRCGARGRRPTIWCADDADHQGVLHRSRLRARPISASRSMAATATSASNGMEQLVRDARIAQIYEGTNGIQALDLVGRKLPTARADCCGGSSIRPWPWSKSSNPILSWRSSSYPLPRRSVDCSRPRLAGASGP